VIKAFRPATSVRAGGDDGAASTIRFSRVSASALRSRSATSATGLPARSEEIRSAGVSSIVTSVPPRLAASESSTRAVPSGRAFAARTIREGSSDSSTSVWSFTLQGPRVTEWWKRDPGAGKDSSLPRKDSAPTTQRG
jgi:hypothetical protein